MNILNRTVITTAVTAAFSLTTMTAMAAPASTGYAEVVTQETVSTQPIKSKALAHRDITATPAFARLNLSNTQKKQIQKINEQYPQQTGLLANDDRAFQSLRQQRRELMVNKQFDEAKARNLLAQESKLILQKQQQRTELELQKLKREHAIYQVLTQKQRDQLMKQRVQRMGW